jgi:D-arabinose 1-dehydrogenase-like Zn-dependent alcohol dehydrogenase
MVVGASPEPIEISPMSLIFDGATVAGSLTGSSIENEDNLRFAVQQGVSAMIEEVALDEAPAAYDRMMSGAARFRMVLNVA